MFFSAIYLLFHSLFNIYFILSLYYIYENIQVLYSVYRFILVYFLVCMVYLKIV